MGERSGAWKKKSALLCLGERLCDKCYQRLLEIFGGFMQNLLGGAPSICPSRRPHIFAI